MPYKTNTLQDRSFRIFVSSTFRDMKKERDLLVKDTFPQIRKLCEDRDVTFTEIDLRWGISDEQKSEGEVLPICLEEIEHCRPYFIGILGERYGWVPEDISDELIEKQPWLKDHKDHSITALEIMHGVLNDPEMKGRAFFYFRHPGYIDELPPEEREELVEGPTSNDIERFGIEGAEERAEVRRKKLEELKGKIRDCGMPVKEYHSQTDLKDLILNDLTAVVDETFPEGSEADPLDKEAFYHEAFAKERIKVYIHPEDSFERLDNHAESADQPLVLLGESGCGKSAMLANWAFQYGESHPDEFVIMHFVGASASSTDWMAMLRKIMQELKRRFDIQQDIPDDKNELKLTFANWLSMAGVQGKVILIIDGVNQLEDKDGAPDLVWLPPHIPENIRLFISTLPGRSLDNLNERGWDVLDVPLLDENKRRVLVEKYLKQYSKVISSELVDMVVSSSQTSNPLFLRSLLEELRVYGDHFTLGQKLEYYLEAKTLEELFGRILPRWEEDYETDRPGLVKDVMRYIWASRQGLSETELMGILGNGDEEPLPKAYWIPFYLAAENALIDRSGLIDFFHDHLRNAVQRRYISNDKDEIDIRLELVDYFEQKDNSVPSLFEQSCKTTKFVYDRRSIYERPWQLAKAKKWEKLHNILKDENLLSLSNLVIDGYDVKSYWALLENNSTYRMKDTYKMFIDDPEISFNTNFYYQLGALFASMGYYDISFLLYQNMVNVSKNIDKIDILHDLLGRQAEILQKQGELEKAMELCKEQETICKETRNKDGLQKSLASQAEILRKQGELEKAIELSKEQETICREIGNKNGLLRSLDNQAVILREQGEFDKSIELLKQQEMICRETGNKNHLMHSLGSQARTLEEFEYLDKSMELLKQVETM
ncbi:DUF4062 domain-containing protein, partial [bacterium]|nr:DUF4062 domain-containing protein [bacterium]